MSAKHVTGEAQKVAELQNLLRANEHRSVVRVGKGALKKFPRSVGIHQTIGRSAILSGQTDKGIFHLKKAAKFEGIGGRATFDVGVAMSSVGRFEEACEAFQNRLRIDPQDHACADALAFSLTQMGEFRYALQFHWQACQLDPKKAQYALHLAYTLERLGMYQEVKKAYEIVLKIDPTSFLGAIGLVRSHKLLRQPEAAIALLEDLIKRYPDQGATLYHELAQVLTNKGAIEDAGLAFQTALDCDPDAAEIWCSYVSSTQDATADIAETIRNLIKKAGPSDQIPLHSALAQVEKRLGNLHASHKAYTEFNRLSRNTADFSIQQIRRQFESSKTQFENLPQPPVITATDDLQPTPIFVIGMPRSGTSLMEAILSAHSDVTATGESEVMAKIACSDLLETKGPDAARAKYLETVAAHVKTGRFTDKMPLNFRFLGQIAHMFPEAKIIHMTRDPRAVAWSMYTTRMVMPTYAFSYDADELCAYFGLYQDMMAYWKSNLPGRVLDVCYESLTSNPNDQIPEILGALGLPFEDACLSPEKNGHMVNTASKYQVRQPIYKGSSDAWRAFEPWAGDWLNRLVSPQMRERDQIVA